MRGGGVHGGGGGMGMEAPARKAPVPHPEPIGAGDSTQSKVFSGPRGALMRGSYWELLFLHWEVMGWVKLQRSRKLEWESILGAAYDPGQEASYEGAVEGLAITAPYSPLAGQP